MEGAENNEGETEENKGGKEKKEVEMEREEWKRWSQMHSCIKGAKES